MSAAAAPPGGGGRPRSGLAKTALRLVGPVILLALILRLPASDRALVGAALGSASPLWILGAVALTLVNVHLKLVRWEALLAVRGIHYPRRRAYAAFLGSLYLGMLTPGRVGDALRVQYLQREAKVPYAEGFASVVADRFADLYVLAVFVAIATAHFGRAIAGPVAAAAWAGVGLTVLLPLVLLVPGLADKVLSRAYAKVSRSAPGASDASTAREQRDGDVRRFLEALRAQVRPSLAGILALTAVTVLITHAQGFLIARALGLEIAFFDVMCLLSVANLLGLLPISVSGLGVREAFYELVFPSLGLAAPLGVVYGLVVFAVVYLVLVAIGFVSWQIAPPPVGKAELRSEQDHG